MKTNKKTFVKRIASLVLVALLLVTALSACSGKQQVVKPTVNSDVFLSIDENCSLTASELSAIAKMLSATYDTDFKTQEILIAAYRGYDMLAEGFDASKIDPAVTNEPNLQAAVNLIRKANLEADSDSKIFFENYTTLNAADLLTLIKSMQTTVDLNASKGALDTVLGWIGVFLGWLTKLCFGSYIGGICLFAIIVELLMLPLSIKQQKNSIKQAKLRPKERAIKKKYAGRDDQVTKQKQSQELQELYQKENVNAAAGCLPLLIQLPILLALYRIVVDPLRYVLGQVPALSSALNAYFTASPAAGGLGKSIVSNGGSITMLSELTPDNLAGLKNFLFYGNGDELVSAIETIMPKMPDFTLGNINLGLAPSFERFDWLLLVPVLTFVIYFFSMRLTKKFTYQSEAMQDQQTACSNWLMDIYMPGMSTFFAFMVPALVGIYWMFKSVISTLRQFIVCKIMPYPQFTEEDYRAAEREYAGKAPKKGETRPDTRTYGKDVQMVGGKPKSLFHMDDDDYVAKIEEEAKREAEEQGEEKIEGVALKQYDRPERKKKNKNESESDGNDAPTDSEQ
ncbi:MAG: membrane protein insertase YidC [Clostridia bacterium]|nr:membrane protein insertase YidC [Clostridia bacterium]